MVELDGHEDHEESGHRRHHHQHHSSRRCTHCGSGRVRRSHRRGKFELLLLPLLLHRPFHCKACSHRYYAFSIGKRTLWRLSVSLASVTLIAAVIAGILTGKIASFLSGTVRFITAPFRG